MDDTIKRTKAECGIRTYSLTTTQGTAMPEATLCLDHHNDEQHRLNSESLASNVSDYSGDEWVNTTDNDEVSCAVCAVGNWETCDDHGDVIVIDMGYALSCGCTQF